MFDGDEAIVEAGCKSANALLAEARCIASIATQTWTASGQSLRALVRQALINEAKGLFGIVLRAGTISQNMYGAARDFQAQFTLARYDVIRCMPLLRIPGGAGSGDLTQAKIDTRRRVANALNMLGGLASRAGSCVWHVIGLECSICKWAIRQT